MSFFEDQKIMITGGGGYLGSKLAERIAPTASSIYLCDIKFNILSKNLAKKYSHVHTLQFDLTKKKNVTDVCKKIAPDYVYHFAALLNRERDFSIFPILNKINVQGTMNLLEALNTVEYKGLFFSSTSEIYGNKNKSPFNENQIPDPVSPYSLSKIMAEYLISTYSDVNRKPYTIMRLFNFYGSGMPENFFISQLEATLLRNECFEMTGGEQVRDFLHIDELLKIIIHLSINRKANNEIVNICSGTGKRLIDLALEIACKLDKQHLLKPGVLPYRNNEIWEMIGDNTKLISLMNKE